MDVVIVIHQSRANFGEFKNLVILQVKRVYYTLRNKAVMNISKLSMFDRLINFGLKDFIKIFERKFIGKVGCIGVQPFI